MTINNSDAHIVDHDIDFFYDKEAGDFSFEPDNDAYQYFDDIENEVVQFIKDEFEIEEISHDEEER